MSTSVTQGSPLAEALGKVVQPKLVEMGWSSDGVDDFALTEYVILMLVNGKSQEQIAEELSNDLLGLGEGDTQAVDFAKWLFEQVEILTAQINGAGALAAGQTASEQAIPSFTATDTTDTYGAGPNGMSHDAEMDEADDSIPTGPRAMRNSRQPGRGRIINQINRALERDSALHRVRGQVGGGGGRVNAHGFNYHGRDNMRSGRPYQNGSRMNKRPMGGMSGVGTMGMQGNPMAGGAGNNLMQMSAPDQMRLMALLEEQARMMAQFMPGMVTPAINPAFQQNGQGRSLFERVQGQPKRPPGNFERRSKQPGLPAKLSEQNLPADIAMDTQPDHSMTDGDQENDSTDRVCHFNLRCTRKDCPYAHQSPAAPEGTAVDLRDVCPFGAACKNKKCSGRHPSPAVKSAHQAEELCRFFPHCANPHCAFKHPSMPLCRNGADCSVEGCKFTHLPTPCKFNPCLNPHCPYKHAEGQKGAFPDKVWTADSANVHVSERKFVADEEAAEELIKPQATPDTTQSEELRRDFASRFQQSELASSISHSDISPPADALRTSGFAMLETAGSTSAS